jgi:hypothetical protein
MLPELSMQTSTFVLLPTVTECVVSAVTVLLATSSVAVPAGQRVPVESVGAPTGISPSRNRAYIRLLDCEVSRATLRASTEMMTSS